MKKRIDVTALTSVVGTLYPSPFDTPCRARERTRLGDAAFFFSSIRRHTRYIGDWSSDVCSSDLPYFRGIAAGLRAAAGGAPEYRVGVYGSGAVCDYLKRARLAEYAWLSNSTAWSGYASFADWNIRQGKQSPSLSFSHDSNEARGEYGGFQGAEV